MVLPAVICIDRPVAGQLTHPAQSVIPAKVTWYCVGVSPSVQSEHAVPLIQAHPAAQQHAELNAIPPPAFQRIPAPDFQYIPTP
ncbi:MAG TPA: hypothetical protein VG269_17485 [Tepidisphaeraceae bacterium]|jgi:hypothetical protein|nr:hypothetical protein [Tepidisphaeraceae bacterium]